MEVKADFNTNILYGKVIGIKSSVSCEGKDLKELQDNFRESVDEYLIRCERKNKSPEKSFSGKVLLRTDADTHRKLFLTAAQKNQSINSWLESLVKLNVMDDDELLEAMYLIESNYKEPKPNNSSVDKKGA